MLNDYSMIDGDSEFRDTARIVPEEHIAPLEFDGSGGETPLGEQLDGGYDDAGWPGDGSGMDDLADYNANEAADYQNE